MPLHVEARGSGRPLLLLHGFTQTGRLWGSFGERLAQSRTLVAVDLPGHAGSDSVRADLPETASLVAEAVRDMSGDSDEFAGGWDLLGYSLGGRVALHVLTGTDLPVRSAVLIGATAGMGDQTERERRRAADDGLADRLEASGDVEAFLDDWLRSPVFARLSAVDRSGRAERLRNSATGLASSLRLCGTGTQVPLWDALKDVKCPLLAVAGSNDTRFAQHALRIADLAPHAVATLVPGGGHAVHLSQADLASRIVRHWLDPDASGLTPASGVS